jgi:hypothetical protein
MKRYDDPYFRGYPMGPQWGSPHRDPNWHDGEYHGHRMEGSHRQGAYGFHRQQHERDLQGYGGFDGIYDEGTGHYNAGGQFDHPYFHGQMQHPRSRPQGYDAGFRQGQGGGVRGDTRFLRQYNANSPELRGGGGYDRGFGWAPHGPRDGSFTNPGLRGRQTNERGYAGYNRGGFAPEGGPVGLDPGKR